MQEIDSPGWHGEPPDNEMPGSVALDVVLASTADLAVYVSAMSVFRQGLEFTTEVRVRPGLAEGDGAERLSTDLHGHRFSGNLLLLGVEFADGRRCANIWRSRMDPATHDRQPHLWSGGGSGGGRSASKSWFLIPLPPPDGFRIICAWPAWDVPETITEVAGGPIHQAAQRARELWPWQPERSDLTPQPPVIPQVGWFAEHARGN